MVIARANKLIEDQFDRQSSLPLTGIGLAFPPEAELTVAKTHLLNEEEKPEK